MFRNYLAAALRNLVRNKLYAAINIVGLAVGFAAVLLIGLFLRDEFSYDAWIPNADRTYLLNLKVAFPGHSPEYRDFIPGELANQLKLDYPSVEEVTRLFSGNGVYSLRRADVESTEAIVWADPNFFDVIKVPVVAGNLQDALHAPDGLVINRRMARKYFGRDYPIGETLEVDRQHMVTVRAVIEDLPSNTHLNFQFVISRLAPFSGPAIFEANPFDVGNAPIVRGYTYVAYTYVRLKTGASVENLQRSLVDFMGRHPVASRESGIETTAALLPLTDIHFSKGSSAWASNFRGNLDTIYAVIALGIFILILASINFINLMTARSMRRAVEVGVRKVSGAERRHLMIQFVGESALYVLLGMMLGTLLSRLLLSHFNVLLSDAITIRHIAFDYWRDPDLAIGMIAVVLAVGGLGGLYPAFVLSSFRPAAVLKGQIVQKAGHLVRQSLVIVQFAILIALIVGAGIVYRQTSYAFREGLRMDTDQVVVLVMHCNHAFRDEVRKFSGVQDAACSGGWSNGPQVVATTAAGLEIEIARTPVDFGFFEIYGLKPIVGRTFAEEHGDRESSNQPIDPVGPPIVINESAVRTLGFTSALSAVGSTIRLSDVRKRILPSEIVGVIPDFGLDAVHQVAPPEIFYLDPTQSQLLNVKLNGRALPETLSAIDRLWARLGDSGPINRHFANEVVENVNNDLTHQRRIVSVLAGIAILVGCLGLFGLSAFTAERRTKEIGVRKALGAGRRDILRLILWEFAKPVLWANVIAWPVGYVAMHRWLEGFANHIDLNPWIFLAGSAVALMVAILTVAGHAILVARAEPVTALRYE